MTEVTDALITIIYNLSISFRAFRMGVKKHVVNREDGIVFFEGGDDSRETVVLIHGFADSKNGHLMVAKKLLGKYRVLIPDLPGFGENTRHHQEKYSISFMAEKVIELLHEKMLGKVHILGNSLGGAVAMEVACKAPELVQSLVLVGSAGFYSADIRTVQNDILEGNYVFQINSDHEFKELVGRVYAKPPRIPSFLFSYLSREFQAQGKWYRKLLDDLAGESSVNDIHGKLSQNSYNDRAKEFPMNTLLLWGQKDKIIPQEMGEFAKSIIPNSTLKILFHAGHAPQHENLSDYMDALLIFLNESKIGNSLMSEI